MRNIITITCCAVLMIYSIGYYFIYSSQISLVKKVNSHPRKTNRTDITIISIALNNGTPETKGFELVEENEIRYNGKMFDIISVKYENGQAVYSCVSDEKETRLETALNDHIEKQSSDHGKKIVAYKAPLLFFEQSELIFSFSDNRTCRETVRYKAPLPVAYLNIPSPPPWHC